MMVLIPPIALNRRDSFHYFRIKVSLRDRLPHLVSSLQSHSHSAHASQILSWAAGPLSPTGFSFEHC